MSTFQDKTSMDRILFAVFTHQKQVTGRQHSFPADTEQLTLPRQVMAHAKPKNGTLTKFVLSAKRQMNGGNESVSDFKVKRTSGVAERFQYP